MENIESLGGGAFFLFQVSEHFLQLMVTHFDLSVEHKMITPIGNGGKEGCGPLVDLCPHTDIARLDELRLHVFFLILF